MPDRTSRRTVLVCGGRNYADRATVFRTLDALHQAEMIASVIQGGARGADRLAQFWAESRGVACKSYPANWEEYGKAAGAIRNKQMLDSEHPDLVIAFAGGRGTADMVRRARKAGVEVVEVQST